MDHGDQHVEHHPELGLGQGLANPAMQICQLGYPAAIYGKKPFL